MRTPSFSPRCWPVRRRRRRCKRPRPLATTRSLCRWARGGGAPQRQPSRLASTTVHPVPCCLCTTTWDGPPAHACGVGGAIMHGRHIHGQGADDPCAGFQAVSRWLLGRRGLCVSARATRIGIQFSTDAVPPLCPYPPPQRSGSAREGKAGRFACDCKRHKGDAGARLRARQPVTSACEGQ